MADTPSKKVRTFEAGPKTLAEWFGCSWLARQIYRHDFFYDRRSKYYIAANSDWHKAEILGAFDDRPIAVISWQYSRAIPAVTVEDLGLAGLQEILDSLVGRELIQEEKR